MRSIALLSFVCLCVAAVSTVAVDAQCSGTVDGKNYDLSKLIKTSGSDYTASDDQSPASNYYWNFCKATIGNQCGTSKLAYQSDSTGTCVSAAEVGQGTWEKWTDGTNNGVKVTWGGGQSCSTGPRQFSAILQCDETADPATIVGKIKEDPHCHYTVTMKSKFVCGSSPGPSSGALSIGSVLLIIGFVSFALYCAAGTVFMMKKKEAKGVEAIPNIDFWKSIPGLVKDGTTFVFGKITGKGSNQSYDSV